MPGPLLVSADPLNNNPSLLTILLNEIENLSPSLPSYIEIEIPEIVLLKEEELQKKIIEFLEEKTITNKNKRENSMIFGVNSVEIRYNRDVQAVLRMFQYKNSLDSFKGIQEIEVFLIFFCFYQNRILIINRGRAIIDLQILVKKWRKFWEVSAVQ